MNAKVYMWQTDNFKQLVLSFNLQIGLRFWKSNIVCHAFTINTFTRCLISLGYQAAVFKIACDTIIKSKDTDWIGTC